MNEMRLIEFNRRSSSSQFLQESLQYFGVWYLQGNVTMGDECETIHLLMKTNVFDKNNTALLAKYNYTKE